MFFKKQAGAISFPGMLVIAGVIFNAGLAVINGNIMGLTPKHVMLVEMMIVGASQYYALTHYRPQMQPWYFFIMVVGIFSIFRMIVTGEFQVKYFRDLLLMQTFIVLGMTASREEAIKMFMVISLLVSLVIVLEAVSLDRYADLFEIKQYYINTRNIDPTEFTAKGSKLYVSSIRPEARYLPFFGKHRLSSLFLESVSLGNFVILMLVFTMTFWPLLQPSSRIFMVLATLLALFASDGRLALAGSLIILAMAPFARFMPRNIAGFILPVILAVIIILVRAAGFQSGEDNFSGRLAYTVELLLQMNVTDYLGLSNRLLEASADSGIIYFCVTHSILIVMFWWVFIITRLPEYSIIHRHYKNGIALYLAFGMLVSFSFTSIKTAAPMWFVYGVLSIRKRDDSCKRHLLESRQIVEKS